MIGTGRLNGKEYQFHTGHPTPDKNLFTTIVGRNGAGKSRLLRNVISDCIGLYLARNSSLSDRLDFVISPPYPTNIVAVSTSPFDRFPMDDLGRSKSLGDQVENYYFYQGLRGLYSSNLSMSFMVRVLGNLIRALTLGDGRLSTVLDVLDYLGYHKHLEARFIINTHFSTLAKIVDADDPVRMISSIADGSIQPGVGAEIRKVTQRLYEASDEVRSEFFNALRNFTKDFKVSKIELVVSQQGVVDSVIGAPIQKDLAILIEFGLLRLRDIRLHKKDMEKPFKISDASSGEQCVVMAMLGIASRIQDGSLVCIDEPEICLHPEWQERYIELLMSTFRGFKNCHFLIATHSPQIISHLNDENCYVLDLHSRKVFDAQNFNNRSADFQLAEIFRAPGFKNEYLMRELLGGLGTLSAGNKIPKSKLILLHSIVALKDKLKDEDPVRQLVILLESAWSGVGHE